MKQVILCVETNKTSATDEVYITDTLKRFFYDDKKIKRSFEYLGSKTRYKDRKVLKGIEKKTRSFMGETSVVYFIDFDSVDSSAEDKKIFQDIPQYCKDNGYDFVFFKRDVEDVFWGKQIEKKRKLKYATDFRRQNRIAQVDIKRLDASLEGMQVSNILSVLSKYWKRKNV